MRTKKKRMILTIALGACATLPLSPIHAGNEFGDNTPLYEDDAWYDISEWFDGNDYNPTDEAIGRWDNEVFNFTDYATSSDADNDVNFGDYGYTRGNQSDWFYDYYDDGFATWGDNYYSSYYDLDDDGLYDAYSRYGDRDADGFYEDFDYYAINSAAPDLDASRQNAQDRQKELNSAAVTVSGTVKDSKMVKVHNRLHLVLNVEASDGKTTAIDFGADKPTLQVFAGDDVQATGHFTKVGDKQLLLAREVTTAGETIAVDRSGRTYDGEVQETKVVNVRGTERLLAKVKTEQGKHLMVDLGLKENMDASIKDGAKVSVRGVPAKVKDRVFLLADAVTTKNQVTRIDRGTREAN